LDQAAHFHLQNLRNGSTIGKAKRISQCIIFSFIIDLFDNPNNPSQPL
jgi:hypothetical protein